MKMSTFFDKKLFEAVKSGQLVAIESAIASGANPNITDPATLLPLVHFAANEKRYDILRALLSGGANPHVKDRDWRTLIRRCVEDGRAEGAKMLIGFGVPLEEVDSVGDTLLHSASARGRKGPVYFAIAKDLIDAGASTTAKNHRGEIPLHHAARYGGDRMSHFIASKSVVNAPDTDGHSPIHAAALGIDNEDGMRALIDAGAAIDARDRNGQTPLHLIGAKPKTRPTDIAVARLLIAAGAALWSRDRDGLTAHDVAAAGFDQRREVHQELVTVLKPSGKEPEPEDQATLLIANGGFGKTR